MDGIEWLEGLKGRGIKPGLERVREAAAGIETDYKIIHVGGTNGKGSVCRFVGSILREAGYTVGIYSSPHLERVNERITVNGNEIGDDELSGLAGILMEQDNGMTYFEAMTVMALMHFGGRVDFAVLEVGMGGRYDATNITDADITVITNVSMEHEQYLGDSIEKIAFEKAGIIKGADVVTACRGRSLDIIEMKAAEQNSPLHVVGRDITWRRISPGRFAVRSKEEYEIETHMNGMFQGENISIAVRVAELLGMGRESIVSGIKNARLPGRMERIGKFLLDGAHNPAGMKALGESIGDFDCNRLFVIFGAMRDKDIPSIIEHLPGRRGAGGAEDDGGNDGEGNGNGDGNDGDKAVIIATGIGGGRAAGADEIAAMVRKSGRKCIESKNVGDAIERAVDMAGDGDIICITGSLYIVGEARSIIKNMITDSPSP